MGLASMWRIVASQATLGHWDTVDLWRAGTDGTFSDIHQRGAQ